MSLDGRIRRVTHLEAEFYEETPESRSSPRGLAESSIVGVTFERGPGDDLLLMKVGRKEYIVPRGVLRAALELDSAP